MRASVLAGVILPVVQVPVAVPAPPATVDGSLASAVVVFQLGGTPARALRYERLVSGWGATSLPGRRWLVHVPEERAAGAVRRLSSLPGVGYATRASAVFSTAAAPAAPCSGPSACLVPDNPCYSSSCGPSDPVVVEYPEDGAYVQGPHLTGQTNLWAVKAGEAWELTHGSPRVLVAVLDTGVNPKHPQLVGRVILGPDVCVEDNPLCTSAFDENGHGTFVTGLITGSTNDGTGIASLGWNTKVIDYKVLGDDGSGNTTDVSTGIYDAVSRGARVINLSDAGPTPNADERAAVEYAIAHGVVVVAAAGNASPGRSPSSTPMYPAAYPGVLSVAASTDSGIVNPLNGGGYLDFSEWGNSANIAAPGINVLSTWYDGQYAVDSGTSFASPLVSATAALMFAVDPDLTGVQATTILRSTASPLSAGGDPINGGVLDAAAAVATAAAHDGPRELDGYELVSANGNVVNAGAAPFLGSMAGRHLSGQIVAAAQTPGGLGYWLVGADGGVFAFGRANYYGEAKRSQLSSPVVGMAPTNDGRGYWLATASGQVLAFGDARTLAPVGGRVAAGSVVGIASLPGTHGYWLVNSAGRVYPYGHAGYYGELKRRLHAHIVGIASTNDGGGYWLVGRDGGVFAFGDATYCGSLVGGPRHQSIVGIVATPGGRGYRLVGAGGRVYGFGDASHETAAGPVPHHIPVVAITS
ncbi:MAG TPA: S8 family serine peptidase [Acidimicrobiales bacterium]|nr:S8 family serine peptidase [Acidimicrobiales bacterium]